jgi:hypothetical protein
MDNQLTNLLIDHILLAVIIIIAARPAARWAIKVNPMFYPQGTEAHWVLLAYVIAGTWALLGILQYLSGEFELGAALRYLSNFWR